MAVINHVKKIRKEKGISQANMAEDLNVTIQTIYAIENHKYDPDLILALRIVLYFDMQLEEVFCLEWEDQGEKMKGN